MSKIVHANLPAGRQGRKMSKGAKAYAQQYLAWFYSRLEKKGMKKLYSMLIISAVAFGVISCSNHTDESKTSTDSSTVVVPPPSNSDATNPSMADTTYSKDTLRRDTTRH